MHLLEPLNDHRALGVLYSNLALQEAAAGRFADAIAYFKKALERHRQVGDEEGLAVTYSQLGKTFLQIEQSQQAERCLNNATEHFVKLGNEAGEAAALRVLADVYERRDDLQSALGARDMPCIELHAGELQRALAQALERFRQAGRRGATPLDSWKHTAPKLARLRWRN